MGSLHLTRALPGTFGHVSALAMVMCGVFGAATNAIADQAAPAQQAAPDANGSGEIVVTAEKHSERVADTPVPVSTAQARALTETNQTQLRDYYTQIPGLTVSPGDGEETMISIRGISSGFNSDPTTAITIDGIPYGSSKSQGGGNTVPDLDPSDLANVQVLRGPQGTLYGASSLGGLINFVTVEPSTRGFSGNVGAGVSGVANGAEAGYAFHGAINAPLSDTLAVRISGFTRQDPGYIDNPVLGIKGINQAHASGGLATALWQPTADFSLKLSALVQDTKADGLSEVDREAGLGPLQQNYLPNIGVSNYLIQLYSATIKVKMAGVNVTSTSSYGRNRETGSFDDSSALGPLNQALFGVSGAPVLDSSHVDKFTQELMLNSTIGSKIDWLIGGFYTHERSIYYQDIDAENPTTGANVGILLHGIIPISYQEIAAFGDLTYHVTPQFDIQIGGRYSYVTESAAISFGGIYNEIVLGQASTAQYFPQAQATTANAFTYLVTPRYKITPDVMVYARLASGFRPGDTNVPSPGVPAGSAPDKTYDYDVGVKASFFERKLFVDASLYYISWKKIQISGNDTSNGFAYTANGGAAKSEGVELSVDMKPVTGLKISAYGDYNLADLTQNFGSGSTLYGTRGDILPFSAKYSANVSARQDIVISDAWTAFFGGAVSYVGDRTGLFSANSDRTNFPSYTKVDLRIGMEGKSWSLTVYANNIGNSHGLLSGGIGYIPAFAYQIVRPRTVGVSVEKKF